MLLRLMLCAAFFVVVSLSPCGAQEREKIALLLDRSPSPANAIGYTHVESLNRLMKEAGFNNPLSSEINELWFIADLNLGKFAPNWEAGYATLKRSVNSDQLVQTVGGYADSIDHHVVVRSPQQVYFVPGTDHPERLGILRPADRALLAGWLSPKVNVQYSPFLASQANQPEAYLSFMMAMDLTNVLSPVSLASRLQQAESLQSNSPESIASVLATLEGFSVIVGRKSLQQCIVKFQFSKSPAALKLIAPQLLAEVLDKNGLAAPEIGTWNVTVDQNTLALQGAITQTTLSGLMSVFSIQSAAERVAGRVTLTKDKESQVGYLSKRYFDDVNAIIERTRDHKAQTTGAMAIWNDKRARQLDEMGTLNVDPDMVRYASQVADLLRGNALNVRQTNIQAGRNKASQGSNGGYYNDGSGYYNDTVDNQRVTDVVAATSAYQDYRETLTQIDKLTSEIRRQMTDKYQMQF